MKDKETKRHQTEPRPEPSQSAPPTEETIINLKDEITSLKEEIDKAKRKIFAQETTILTIKNQKAHAVHRFAVLQAKYDALQAKQAQEITPPVNAEELKRLQAILGQQWKNTEHDEPPKK